MPRTVGPDHLPTEEEITDLCAALLSEEETGGDRIILAARRDGVPIDVIHLGYVASAARRLGQLWVDDQISFVDVTLASGRLYRIIRGLRHIIDKKAVPSADTKSVLFALAPGETHTLGIEIAADLFRREGWDVALSVGEGRDEVVAQTQSQHIDAVVLVAQADRSLADVVALVLAIRITQPYTHVVVAGNIVDNVDDVGNLVGADAVIGDIEHAVSDLEKIISKQT
jgi:methanogenic corrinoid protein MtbC1